MASRRGSGARRRSKASWRNWKKQLALPGWALLLAGLALGVAVALLAELVGGRPGSTDGLAGLFHERAQPPPPPAPEPPKPRPAPIKPQLDFYTVLPEVETVLPDRGARPARARAERPEENVRYVLQAGSFAHFEEADELKARLALQGLQARIQKVTIEGKGEFHRVRLGPYDTLEALDSVNRRLSEMGIQTLRLKVKRDAG